MKIRLVVVACRTVPAPSSDGDAPARNVGVVRIVDSVYQRGNGVSARAGVDGNHDVRASAGRESTGRGHHRSESTSLHSAQYRRSATCRSTPRCGTDEVTHQRTVSHARVLRGECHALVSGLLHARAARTSLTFLARASGVNGLAGGMTTFCLSPSFESRYWPVDELASRAGRDCATTSGGPRARRPGEGREASRGGKAHGARAHRTARRSGQLRRDWVRLWFPGVRRPGQIDPLRAGQYRLRPFADRWACGLRHRRRFHGARRRERRGHGGEIRLCRNLCSTLPGAARAPRRRYRRRRIGEASRDARPHVPARRTAAHRSARRALGGPGRREWARRACAQATTR